MDQVVKAGISGFVIAVIITLFSPVDLYFFPPFMASIIAIYVFELKTIKEGVLVAFITYVFTEWIWGSVNLTTFLASNKPISLNLIVDVWMVLNQILTPITALLAGLIGSALAEAKRRPPLTLPPPPLSTPVPVASPEEKKYCRYCGIENKNDAVFCEKCGKKIG